MNRSTNKELEYKRYEDVMESVAGDVMKHPKVANMGVYWNPYVHIQIGLRSHPTAEKTKEELKKLFPNDIKVVFNVQNNYVPMKV